MMNRSGGYAMARQPEGTKNALVQSENPYSDTAWDVVRPKINDVRNDEHDCKAL